MNQSTAHFSTERASGYLQQLCKHFGHRIPVEFTPERGQITFPAGMCRLAASDGVLTLEVEANDAAGLVHLQDVIERHLVRFAFREPPKLEWNVQGGAAA